MKILLVVLIAVSPFLWAQEKTSPLHHHSNLVGGTWQGEGQWGDGSPFKLHVAYQWGLSGKLIRTKTYGNVKQQGFEFGLRNEGIRVWRQKDEQVRFWEFDIFGGITEGVVYYHQNNIYYCYSYDTGQGTMALTDGWEYVDQDTYDFKVGVYNRDTEKWEQTFLSTQMKREAH